MATTISTRRQFVAASAALPFALKGLAQSAAPSARWVFFGSLGREGIYRAAWDSATGELGPLQLTVATDGPDFLAMHPKLPMIYAVNPVGAPKAGLSSFRLDAAKGTLTAGQRVSAGGSGPCFVSVDATGRSAFVANYGDGSVAAYRLGAGGELSEPVVTFACQHKPACGVFGPVKDRQDGPHMHCTTVAPGNDFMLACNLGEDAIEVFPITPGAAKPMGAPMHVAARVGSGPRHVAFHPNGKWVYCIHELDSTIDLYDWKVAGSTASMTLRAESVITTLAPGVSPEGKRACEIVLSDDARFVYACSRGDDTLIVYRVDAATGLLTEQQRLGCGGKAPRIFAFDPTRRWLVCANEDSSNVTIFAHDATTGRIGEKPKTYAAKTPMFVLFV